MLFDGDNYNRPSYYFSTREAPGQLLPLSVWLCMSFWYPTSHNTNITVASWESTVEIYTLSTASGDNFRDTHRERSQTTKYIIISYMYEVKNKWPSIRCIPLASLVIVSHQKTYQTTSSVFKLSSTWLCAFIL